MPNEHYQSMFGFAGPELRSRFLDGAPPDVEKALGDVSDEDVGPLVQDLGGHDVTAMIAAYAESATTSRTTRRWCSPTP